MLIPCFMQKIIFTVKKIHKNCCKQSCSFWLRYQPNRLAAGASPPDPTAGGYSAHPGPLAVFRKPTSYGRKDGEGRGWEKGRRRKGELGRASIEMMPPNQNPNYATAHRYSMAE